LALSRWLERLRERLISCDELNKADLIFVLAGHRNRKIYGARLLRDGWAASVLMSTENPGYIATVLEQEVASRWEPTSQVWQRVHDATRLSPPGTGYFFAKFDCSEWVVEPIVTRWFGTLSEINALAGWLSRHASIRSLLIVSSAMHSKRIGMCCRRLIPTKCSVRIIAVPVDQASSDPALPRERTGARRILAEWAKVILYWFVLPLYPRPSGAR
jgi:hypothetical protein